jgi:hypothetical protein
LNPFEEPISLEGIKLVRIFAACLAHLPEERGLPQSAHEIWSMPLSEAKVTEAQMLTVGNWYAEHHLTGPSLPYVLHALRTLKSNGSLPTSRLAGKIERNAMNVLKSLEGMGISTEECAQSLMLAGTLAHLAVYRRKHPDVDRSYLRNEVEGLARMSDYMADEILDEIERGQGDLQDLRPVLFRTR